MDAIEVVALPVLAIALAVAAVLSWRHNRRRAKLLVVFTAVVIDGWLWLAASEPPIGPHLGLLYLLLLVNAPIAFGLIYQTTGFTMNPRGARTYEDPVVHHGPDYDGLRGD